MKHTSVWTERVVIEGEGFPFAVKANIAARGFQHHGASPAFLGNTAEASSLVVQAFEQAGGVVAGTTNMHELAFGITSQNAHFGTPEVPGHPGHSAGGSSGGSAAAVAQGDVDFALGTDTGGSVTIPSAICGVVGYRPTTGRWPNDNLLGLSWTRDTIGVITTSVRDAQLADNWVTHYPAVEAPARMRLGIPRQLVAELSPEVREAFDQSIDQLRPTADILEVDFETVLQPAQAAAMPIVLWESRILLAHFAAGVFGLAPGQAFSRLGEAVASGDVKDLLSLPMVAAEEYARAQQHVIEARQHYATAMKDFDALVFPTVPRTAAPMDAGAEISFLGEPTSTFGLYTRNTEPGTILAAPAVTIPIAREGLPVGLTVQGLTHKDEHLLAVAEQLESALAS